MTNKELRERFVALFGSLASIGGSRASGYERLVLSPAELQTRAWFRAEAERLGLDVEVDGNTNMWAWWGSGRSRAVGTGSHLDTVIKGGAYDGALGIVSALLAVERLQQTYDAPSRSIAVVAFAGEEGARFGLPTMGSRLLTGALAPEDVLNRSDRQGATLGGAMVEAGFDPDAVGKDPDRLRALSCYVELHVEQGRGLVFQNAPVGVISDVWPHGRYRFNMTGTADHAGAASMEGRADPMLALAHLVVAAEETAGESVRMTIGRVDSSPNSTNTIAHQVSAWLDARGAVARDVRAGVERVRGVVTSVAERRKLSVECLQESWSPAVTFDPMLSATVQEVLLSGGFRSSQISTAAGHDAAILGAHIPTAMLHVRNPSGVSHAPAETASTEDCVAGVEALTLVLEKLACT
jgi:beta-ureidopropionase / N-carbamoyl-L-amino-acid hydrolase